MRRPYFDRKEFNEYFAPIMGYLRKSCGRPWDKVWSELNVSLSGGGTVVDHVRVHVLRDFVTLQPVWHNGVPCYPYHNYRSIYDEPMPINGRFNRGFYVDRQGILRQAPMVGRKKDKPKLPCIPIDQHSAYYKIDGAWFRVWVKDLQQPASADSVPVYDVVLKKWVKTRSSSSAYRPEPTWAWYVEGTKASYNALSELFDVHGSYRIGYRKEQLSNRTIRREKLNERLAEVLHS